MQCELAHLSSTMQGALRTDDATPQRLFYPTDAVGLAAALKSQSLRALDWRLGWRHALTHYGIGMVEEFRDLRSGTLKDPLRKTFCETSRLNFNLRGAHFGAFIARVFSCSPVDETDTFRGYALGLSVPCLAATTGDGLSKASMRLAAAIYDRDQQRSVINLVYSAYEDYFVSAVQRFGKRHRER